MGKQALSELIAVAETLTKVKEGDTSSLLFLKTDWLHKLAALLP